MPTNRFSIKPLKFKLLAGEQKATKFWERSPMAKPSLAAAMLCCASHKNKFQALFVFGWRLGEVFPEIRSHGTYPIAQFELGVSQNGGKQNGCVFFEATSMFDHEEDHYFIASPKKDTHNMVDVCLVHIPTSWSVFRNTRIGFGTQGATGKTTRIACSSRP